MKRIASLLIIIASLLSAPYAAAEFNIKEISATASTSKYNSLLNRFKSGDAKLTEPEAATVYYGAASLKGFNPDVQYTALTSAFAEHKYPQALAIAQDALEKDPTNLALLFKAYACAKATNNEAEATKFQTRLLQICDVIFHSGKGVTIESPLMVTRKSDIDEFVVKYLQPTQILGTSPISNLTAVKVSLEGIADPVIFYFKTI